MWLCCVLCFVCVCVFVFVFVYVFVFVFVFVSLVTTIATGACRHRRMRMRMRRHLKRPSGQSTSAGSPLSKRCRDAGAMAGAMHIISEAAKRDEVGGMEGTVHTVPKILELTMLIKNVRSRRCVPL